VIESKDACAVMRTHDAPTTLHYVDPPYVFATRADLSKDYAHELTDADHSRAPRNAQGAIGHGRSLRISFRTVRRCALRLAAD
jgi:site-specific DNA-adenine methylase